jgi:hypothetical protein
VNRRFTKSQRKHDGVPRPVARFGRRRLRIVALGLIGLVLVASSFLQSTSSQLLRHTLDANWRGDYDILVTAAGHSPIVGGDDTLLATSALTDASLGHIPSSLVAAVQGLPGIDVAAPIGGIATRTQGTAKVTLTIPLDGQADGPRAYRVTTTLAIDDGVSASRTIEDTLDFVIDQTAWQGFATVTTGDVPPRAVTSSGQVVPGSETDPARNIAYVYGGYDDPIQPPRGEGVATITLPVPTVETAHILLVDPVAEKQLLGVDGDIMNPLIETSSLIGVYGSSFFDPARLPQPGDDLTTLQDKGVVARPTPVLTRQVNTPPANLTVDLAPLLVPADSLAPALRWPVGDEASPFPADLLASAPVDEPQTIYSGSPGDALSPLTFDTVDIAWPGYTLAQQPDYAKYPLFREAGSPILSSIDPMQDTMVQPTGSGSELSLVAAGVSDGELSFNSLSPYRSVVTAGAAPYETATWPVGSFSPADFRSESAGLGRLGLGYDGGSARTIAVGSQHATPDDDSAGLPPSWSGLGLDISGALGIADLANAQYWDITDPVSSVRVRVTGIDGHTPEAQSRLLHVADSIRALGLEATVVAGSSPETVAVHLEGPAGSASTAGGPIVALDYSRLGAAALVKGGVAGTDLALLVLAVVAGTALLVSVQYSSIPARRSDSAVLRQIGWPRSRIRRWLLSEEVVPLAVLLLVGLAAFAISTVKEATWPLVAIALTVSMASSALLVERGSSLPRAPSIRRTTSRAQRLRGPVQLGLREAGTNWGATAVLAATLALVHVTTSTAVLILAAGREAAGDSRLGSMATAQALLPQGLLIAVTLAASCVLIIVVRRLGIDRRQTQLQAMHAMGWQRKHLRKSAIAEILTAALPGLVVGSALTVAVGSLLAPSAGTNALAAGSVATTLAAGIVVRSSLIR